MKGRYRGASVHPYRKNKNKWGWRVRWREQNKQMSKSFDDEGEANAYARKTGIAVAVISEIRENTLTPGDLSQLLPRYIEVIKNRNKPGSAHSRNVNKELKGIFEKQGWKLTTEISERALDEAVDAFGSSRRMAHKVITDLKSFLRWAKRAKHSVDADALLYKTPKHSYTESISWSDEEVDLLLGECEKPNGAEVLPSGMGTGRGSKAIMGKMAATKDFNVRKALFPPLVLMLRYAPRPKETTLLNVENWNGRIRVLNLPGRITKNGRPRSFVVDEYTAGLIDSAAKMRSGQEPLFIDRSGNRWTPDNLEGAIRRLMDRVGLPGTPYSCRHTACTRLCRLAQGDLGLVKSITGHRTLSELEKYLHVTVQRQRVVADAYSALQPK